MSKPVVPLEPSVRGNSAMLVANLVLNAMQAAEEIGGPESGEYVSLMRWIAAEASSRADNCCGNMAAEADWRAEHIDYDAIPALEDDPDYRSENRLRLMESGF